MKARIVFKQTKPKIILKELPLAVSRFNRVFESVNARLTGRSTEVGALASAVATKENLLLDGLHGTAKSMLVSTFFDHVTDANLFRARLWKGTKEDEIFGVLDTERYRRKAEWHRNVTGMLPSAHFAYLDEVYRASEMLLPSMMGVLNEREYHNGTDLITCPLHSAIGTCNMILESEELDAVHDRWLVKVRVKPLESSTERIRMLRQALDRLLSKETPTMSLEDIVKVNSAIKYVVIEDQCLELYEEIVRLFAEKAKQAKLKSYISDRRLVLALKLAQASYVREKPGAVLEEEPMPYEFLGNIMGGIVMLNDSEYDSIFSEVVESVISTVKKYEQEDEELTVLESATNDLQNRFDESMTKKQAEALRNAVALMQSGLNSMPDEKKPQKETNSDRLRQIEQKLDSLVQSLAGLGIN